MFEIEVNMKAIVELTKTKISARRRAPHDATTANVKSIQLVHDDWFVDAMNSPGENIKDGRITCTKGTGNRVRL